MQIKMLSDTLIGSGEGFGATIDTDIIFDNVGIPYIPAKRVKGLLRDSARNINKMFSQSFPKYDLPDYKVLFGDPGKDYSCPIKISDFYIHEYDANYKWLDYYLKQAAYENFLSKDLTVDYFTNIRKSTTVDDKGIAKKHSLRTYRVLSKDPVFTGKLNVEIDSEGDTQKFEKLLVFACQNLKSMGTKRNRGLGEIECKLYKDNKDLNESIFKELEEECKK
ncbi:MAG: RAMP superfamily CRISPR-associated protein [bacterium]|nr:RAMP superfamily CRISPR-associated protein [bacterium]